MRKLRRSFYDRDTVLVARDLLGKHLVHVSRGVERIGRIVEVEAYLGPHDLAAHSSRGLTERTKVMFGPPGHAYVYLIYGMYHCMNVVTERDGHASAVRTYRVRVEDMLTTDDDALCYLCPPEGMGVLIRESRLRGLRPQPAPSLGASPRAPSPAPRWEATGDSPG